MGCRTRGAVHGGAVQGWEEGTYKQGVGRHIQGRREAIPTMVLGPQGGYTHHGTRSSGRLARLKTVSGRLARLKTVSGRLKRAIFSLFHTVLRLKRAIFSLFLTVLGERGPF